MKKQIKSRLFDYTCPECGWKASRGTQLFSPACSLCGSEEPPIITEREVVKEIEINQTYTDEDYENVKRITREIAEGKPLEDIEGIDLWDGSNDNLKPLFRYKRMCVGQHSRMVSRRAIEDVCASLEGCCAGRWEEPLCSEEDAHNYY